MTADTEPQTDETPGTERNPVDALHDELLDEPRETICPECDGNGFPADYPNRTCKMCFGSGKVMEVRRAR